MFAWGKAMGEEFWAKGANVQLGPGMNVARVPRNGRNFELVHVEDEFTSETLYSHVFDLGICLVKIPISGRIYILSDPVALNSKFVKDSRGRQE